MTTGERIKCRRKELSMSAEQLAEKVSLSPATIYRYEKGDIVAIHSQPSVENGEIAAVLIETDATLKRVFLFKDHIELRAENPSFPSIVLIGEDMNQVIIEGKAVGLCRDL